MQSGRRELIGVMNLVRDEMKNTNCDRIQVPSVELRMKGN